jgi:hypothetical protein
MMLGSGNKGREIEKAQEPRLLRSASSSNLQMAWGLIEYQHRLKLGCRYDVQRYLRSHVLGIELTTGRVCLSCIALPTTSVCVI